MLETYVSAITVQKETVAICDMAFYVKPGTVLNAITDMKKNQIFFEVNYVGKNALWSS